MNTKNISFHSAHVGGYYARMINGRWIAAQVVKKTESRIWLQRLGYCFIVESFCHKYFTQLGFAPIGIIERM